MIRTTDFRVGNIIKFEGELQTITQVGEDFVKTKEHIRPLIMSQIESVPLTYELLKQIGFLRDSVGYSFTNVDYNSIEIEEFIADNEYFVRVEGSRFGEPFYCFHQLQNICYWVIDEEVTIKY